MLLAARVFAPLMAIFITGESAMGSLKVAVMIREVPDFTCPVGAYVIAAVGAVVSTNTPAVLGGVKVSEALFVASSWMVPPFNAIGEEETIPLESLSPARTV